MAEPQQQPEKKGPSKWRQRIKNIFITGVRRAIGLPLKSATGYDPQYELYEGQDLLEIQPVKRLKKKNILAIMEARSNATSTVEANWDFFEELRKEIEDVYAKSMIYIDAETAKFEFNLYQNGLANGDIEKDEMIQIMVRGKKYQYPVPPKGKIRYSIAGMKKEWIATISPFGYNNAGNYSGKYRKLINQMCEDVKSFVLSTAKNEIERNAVTQRFEYIKAVYSEMINDILLSYCGSEEETRPSFLKVYAEIEKNYYNFVKAASESSLKIDGFYDKLSQKRFRREDFVYYNTFKVVQPIMYGKGAESAVVKEILIDKNDATDYKKIYGQNIKIAKWDVKENELGPGLDPFGYPLEVDDDGTIMLDKHSEGTKRKVPSQFIRRLDLLETVNYINAHHDTYRDDLRDGRYHPYSITIMDYVQANNKSVWGLWGMRNEDSIKTQSRFSVKSNAPGVGTLSVDILPSDKNPAFDFKFLKGSDIAWKHAGRKYYYDVPDGTMKWDNNEPHISSRGVSMYIIEKLTRDMRKFDQTIAILNEIGTKGGFDYGTRPWDLWGKTMIQNIFAWRNMMEAVNKPMPPKHTEKEYGEMYSTK